MPESCIFGEIIGRRRDRSPDGGEPLLLDGPANEQRRRDACTKKVRTPQRARTSRYRTERLCRNLQPCVNPSNRNPTSAFLRRTIDPHSARHRPSTVIAVQQTFGDLGERLSQKIAVTCLHGRILMAETQFALHIDAAQSRSAQGRSLLALADRLAAASDAAARARHDFDEIVGDFATVDDSAQRIRIRKAARSRDTKLSTRKVERFLAPTAPYAVITDFFECIGIGIRTRCKEIRRAQSRLHHAPGNAENMACAGSDAQRSVEVLLVEQRDVQETI